MLERLLIVAIVAVVGVLLYHVYRQQQLRQVARQAPSDPILKDMRSDMPIIVYFTTPGCIPCKTQQQPVLERLQERLPVQVVQINAAEDPDAAQRWGVMTAPTTFILGVDGRPQAVNHGVADENRLLEQLQAANQIA